MRLLWSIIKVIYLYCSLILWNILIYVNFNNLYGMLNVMKFKLFINYCSLKQQYIYIYRERERERERERMRERERERERDCLMHFEHEGWIIGQVFKPYRPHIIFTIHFGKTPEISHDPVGPIWFHLGGLSLSHIFIALSSLWWKHIG